jgi:hypothetical protein
MSPPTLKDNKLFDIGKGEKVSNLTTILINQDRTKKHQKISDPNSNAGSGRSGFTGASSGGF